MIVKDKLHSTTKYLKFKQLGEGPNLILIGGDSQEWGSTIEYLSQYFTIVIPSFSYQVLSKQRNNDMVDYLKIIVEELELEHFSLLAHSLGVYTAVLFTQLNPQMVDSLVLSNVPDLEMGNKDLFDNLFRVLTRKNKPDNYLERDFWFQNFENQIRDLNDKYRAQHLPIHTLLISGDNDFLSSGKALSKWKAYLNSNSNLKVFKHSGHFPMKDNPVYFSLVVKDFITKYSLNQSLIIN